MSDWPREQYTYEDFQRQQRDIEQDYSSQPHIGAAEDITTLLDNLDPASRRELQSKVVTLRARFAHYHPVRRDGNCFFRSFLFKLWLEASLLSKETFVPVAQGIGNVPLAPSVLEQCREFVRESREPMLAAGFPDFAIDDLVETVGGCLDEVMVKLQSTIEERRRNVSQPSEAASIPFEKVAEEVLLALFNDGPVSDYCVSWARFVTSAYLRLNETEYAPFLQGEHLTIDSLCSKELEPMGKEADHLQISACVAAFRNVAVVIHYVDGSAYDVVTHEFGQAPLGGQNALHLLYRPGHYDSLCM